MSDQHEFEVYPPAAEAGPAPAGTTAPVTGQTWEQPGVPTTTPASYPLTTYRAPQVSPPPPSGPGPSRRGVIGLLIGVPIAGVIMASWANGNGRSEYDPGSEYTEDGGYVDDGGGESDTGTSIDVGGYPVDVPDGWSQDWVGSDEVTLTNGANRLLVRAFSVNDGDQAMDLVRARVTYGKGDFVGTLGKPVDQSDDADRALVKATGKVGKKAARLIGQLWIGEDNNALLLVRVLTAKEGSTVSDDAQSMVDQLEYDFG